MSSMKEVVIGIRLALALSGLLLCCGTCALGQDDQPSAGRQDDRNNGNRSYNGNSSYDDNSSYDGNRMYDDNNSYDDNSNSGSGRVNGSYQPDRSARDLRDTEELHRYSSAEDSDTSGQVALPADRVIEITRLHPGEKLSEILIDDTTETLRPTPFAKIGMISSEPFDVHKFSQQLTALEEASWRGSAEDIHGILGELNIGFRSPEAQPHFAGQIAPAASLTAGESLLSGNRSSSVARQPQSP